MRRLAPHQTFDPARGSFLVRPRMVKEERNGQRTFVAPTEPIEGSSEAYETFSNSIQFQPIGDNN